MEPLRKDGCESFLDNYNILSLEAPVAIVLSHEAEFYVFSPSVDVLLCQWQVAFNEISLDMRYYHGAPSKAR